MNTITSRHKSVLDSLKCSVNIKKLAEGEKMTYAVYNHAYTPARMHTHTLKPKDKLKRVSVDTDYITYILKLTHILQLYQSISVERVNGSQKN